MGMEEVEEDEQIRDKEVFSNGTWHVYQPFVY